MGSPYLNSGESITMTTHRVGVESIPYDVMLTTHRLTLIDSRYARFEPLMVAFGDILTVKSGAVSTGEPVIILTYNGAGDEVREMNLIFSQQPGEHRKHERDHWVKKLMESIITEREENVKPDEIPEAEPDSMQPSMRHWVAPDGIAPHTPFTEKDPAQPGITIIPDNEGPLFERAALPEEPEETPEDHYTDLTEEAGAEENSSYLATEPVEPVAEPAESGYWETYEDGEDEFIPAPPANSDLLHKFHTIVIPFVPADEPAPACYRIGRCETGRAAESTGGNHPGGSPIPYPDGTGCGSAGCGTCCRRTCRAGSCSGTCGRFQPHDRGTNR